jgi:hypothetical protein
LAEAVPDRELAESVTLLANLVNRDEQWKPLETWLKKRLSASGPDGPLFVVLPGQANDLHRTFIYRCAKYEIPRLMKSRSWLIPGTQLAWPHGATTTGDLFAALANALSLSDDTAPVEIASNLKKRGCSVCVGFAVERSVWKVVARELLASWIMEMDSHLRPLPDGQCIIIFVSMVLTGKDPDPQRADILKICASMNSTASGSLNLLVLPRMSQVQWLHVDDWISRCEEAGRWMLKGMLDENILVAAPYDIFGEDDALALPMAQIHKSLIEVLKRAYTPTQFAR